MSESTGPSHALTEDAIPRLPRGVRIRRDEVRQRTVLLAPERTVALDPVGCAILDKVDGVRSLGAIIDELAATYAAPRDRIARDVLAFLQDLAHRGFLDVAP